MSLQIMRFCFRNTFDVTFQMSFTGTQIFCHWVILQPINTHGAIKKTLMKPKKGENITKNLKLCPVRHICSKHFLVSPKIPNLYIFDIFTLTYVFVKKHR